MMKGKYIDNFNTDQVEIITSFKNMVKEARDTESDSHDFKEMVDDIFSDLFLGTDFMKQKLDYINSYYDEKRRKLMTKAEGKSKRLSQ